MADFATPKKELIFADFESGSHLREVRREIMGSGETFDNFTQEHCDVLRIRDYAAKYDELLKENRIDRWYSAIVLLYRELKDARRGIRQAGYGHCNFGAAIRLRDPLGAPLVAAETLGSLAVQENERFLFLPNHNQLLTREPPFEVGNPASTTLFSGLAVVLQHRDRP